jgi:hypothetical protein
MTKEIIEMDKMEKGQHFKLGKSKVNLYTSMIDLASDPKTIPPAQEKYELLLLPFPKHRKSSRLEMDAKQKRCNLCECVCGFISFFFLLRVSR